VRNKTLQVDDEVRAVLAAATIRDNTLTLVGALDRALYGRVDKVLKAAGGKWNRKAGAHLFDRDPRGALAPALTGQLVDTKKQLEQFWTPVAFAERLVDVLEPLQGARVLEPSAGSGRLATAARARGASVVCCEIDPRHGAALKADGFEVWQGDFTTMTAADLGVFDAVVMNPPFSRDQDVRHVLHAWTLVKPGGVLGAIVGPGFTFKERQVYDEFRAIHASVAEYEAELPAGTFKESGTMVRTVMVAWRKPGAP
jgi:predicted RNA methylase